MISNKIGIICVILVVILGVNVVPSFAQTAPNVTVTTDKPSYTIDDSIVISGAVKAVVIGTPLTIQILDPNNTIVQIDSIDVSQDGNYAKSILASGPLWKASGTYTVKVQYGPTITAQTTFAFASSITPISSYFIVKDPNSQQTFSVNYNINGGTLKGISIATLPPALLVSINSINDGSITLQIPRLLLDAKTAHGQNTSFIILIDGAEVKPQSESANADYRTLTISFLQGDQGIQIIGTGIFPNSSPPPILNPTSITVSTDKLSYNIGDNIVVSGIIDHVIPDTPVTIQIFDINNNELINTAQIEPSSDGKYIDVFTNIATLLKSSGTYKIKVQCGFPNVASETTFAFTISAVSSPTSSHTTENVTNSSSEQQSQSSGQPKIPAWVKNIFIWYGRGSISDDELIGALQFLVQQGIIKV